MGQNNTKFTPNINNTELFNQYDSLKFRYHNDIIHCKASHVESFDRYSNIIPYEFNRVNLKHSDKLSYINASWFDSPLDNNRYIATQAPLPNTINHFWSMIYDYKVPAIYMLTKLKEETKVKADCYWPTDKPLIFRDLTIKLVDVKKYNKADLCKRIFEIRDRSSNNIHIVNQYHYTGWPDHSVPSSAAIDKLLDLMDRYYCSAHGPQVIHCSAGIGRTGVLLALHYCRIMIHSGMYSTIFHVIESLRKQRVGMVNTFDQYKFIHNYLANRYQ